MKNAQGMSINVIIVAIIALIVLVIVIMLFSGKFDDFRSGIGKAVTCEDACKAIGMRKTLYSYDGDGCLGLPVSNSPKIISGTYSDVTGANEVCCCRIN